MVHPEAPRLGATIHRPSMPPGPAPCPRLVLVHGFTQTRRSWAGVAGILAGGGYQVVTVDAPGHGGSSHIQADMPSAAHLLASAGGRATYVGYSMGARLCLHLALSRPDLVERLVLLGATAGIEEPGGRAARRAADEALAAELEGADRRRFEEILRRWLAQPLFASLSPSRSGLDDRLGNHPGALAASLRLAGAGAQDSLWPRLASLSMPVLVLAGSLDTKFVALGGQLVDAIGANADLELVPGAGHPAHLEQPAGFASAVMAFLDRPAAGSDQDTDRQQQTEGQLQTTGGSEHLDQGPSLGPPQHGPHAGDSQRKGTQGQQHPGPVADG